MLREQHDAQRTVQEAAVAARLRTMHVELDAGAHALAVLAARHETLEQENTRLQQERVAQSAAQEAALAANRDAQARALAEAQQAVRDAQQGAAKQVCACGLCVCWEVVSVCV